MNNEQLARATEPSPTEPVARTWTTCRYNDCGEPLVCERYCATHHKFKCEDELIRATAPEVGQVSNAALSAVSKLASSESKRAMRKLDAPEAGEPLTAGPRSKMNDAELFVIEERSNTRGNWLPLPDAYTTQDEGLKVLERKLKAGGFRYKRLMVYQAREEVKTLQCSNCGRVQMFSSSAIASWIIAENGGVLCPNHK